MTSVSAASPFSMDNHQATASRLLRALVRLLAISAAVNGVAGRAINAPQMRQTALRGLLQFLDCNSRDLVKSSTATCESSYFSGGGHVVLGSGSSITNSTIAVTEGVTLGTGASASQVSGLVDFLTLGAESTIENAELNGGVVKLFTQAEAVYPNYKLILNGTFILDDKLPNYSLESLINNGVVKNNRELIFPDGFSIDANGIGVAPHSNDEPPAGISASIPPSSPQEGSSSPVSPPVVLLPVADEPPSSANNSGSVPPSSANDSARNNQDSSNTSGFSRISSLTFWVGLVTAYLSTAKSF